MKFTTTILAALFLSATTLSAGSGLLASLNSHTWVGDDAELMGDAFSYAFSSDYSQSAAIGLSIGAFYELYSNQLFSIEPEVHWIMKGSAFKGEFQYGYYSYDTQIAFNLNYIEVPCLLKFPITSNPQKTHVHLMGGPFFGVNIGSSLVVKVDDEQEEEDLDDFESTNYGFIVGGGIVFPSGFFVDVRYHRDLSPALADAELFNRVVGLYVGFSY